MTEYAYYFGFGSLVNRSTRPDTEQAWNATLKGWQRVWNHRVVGSARHQSSTSLNIEPASSSIDGVLVKIPVSELAGLDLREAGYDRLTLSSTDFELPEHIDASSIYAYRSCSENRILADIHFPIAQSYIDCVMAGYLARFGAAGLANMLSTTRGWDRKILNDRNQPIYPRHVVLPAKQLKDFDAMLSEHR